MVGVLIRMRLCLLRNSFTGIQAMTLGLGLLGGLALAAAGVWLSLLDLRPVGFEVDLLCALFALWALGWLIGPLFVSGGGGGLVPDYFAALPIAPRRLAGGLLVAGFVGVGPLVTLVAFGAAVTYAARLGPAAWVVGVVATMLQLVAVLLASKVLVDLTRAAITSTVRAVLSAVPWAVVGAFVAQSWMLFPLLSGLAGVGPVLSTVVRVLPSGWAMVAIDAAGRSDWPLVLAPVAGLAGLVFVLLRVWSALIVRRTSQVITVRPARAGGSDVARFLLPANPIGAVAAKEIRSSVRDLNRALFLSFAVCFGVAFALVPLLVGNRLYLAAAGVIIALLATTGSAQLYSEDGTALWYVLMSPGSERSDVRGRQLGWLLLVAPFAVLSTVGGVLLSGAGWAWPWVLSLLPAALGGGAGLVVAVSVWFLVPMAEPRHRSRGAAGGDGTSGLIAWAMLPLAVLTVLPAAILPLVGTLVDSVAVRWAGVPVGIGSGVLLAWLLGRMAHRRLHDRGAELLALMRTGTGSRLQLPAWGSAQPEREPVRPMSPAKAAGVWALYLVGAVLLIAQGGVAVILIITEASVRAWFVALYLPDSWKTVGALSCAAAGVITSLCAWSLSKKHDRAARKRFGLL